MWTFLNRINVLSLWRRWNVLKYVLNFFYKYGKFSKILNQDVKISFSWQEKIIFPGLNNRLTWLVTQTWPTWRFQGRTYFKNFLSATLKGCFSDFKDPLVQLIWRFTAPDLVLHWGLNALVLEALIGYEWWILMIRVLASGLSSSIKGR